jgi:hypothetical protein
MVSQITVLNNRMINEYNNELENMQKKVYVTYFKVLFWNFPGLSKSLSWQLFEPKIS